MASAPLPYTFYSIEDVERDMLILGRPKPHTEVDTIDPLWVMGRVHERVNPYAPTHLNPNPPPRPPPRKVQFAIDIDAPADSSPTASASATPLSSSSNVRTRQGLRKPAQHKRDENEDSQAPPRRGTRKVSGGGVSKKLRNSRNA